VKIRVGPNVHALPIAQVFERFGQILLFGRRCPVDKEGNHPDIAPQGRFDLDPDVVSLLVEPPLAGLIGGIDPAFTDHGQEHVAASEHLGQASPEVYPEADGIDILENSLFAE